MGNPCDLIRNTSGAGLWDPYSVAAIVFEGRAEVPAVDCMNIVAPAVGRAFVDKDFHARGSNGCTSVVERTVDMCMGRELRIESRLAKEI